MPIFQQGTVNTTSLIVPDVYVQIVPPAQLNLNGVPSNMVGLVGSAPWGPVNVPTSVSSMTAYAYAFGTLVNRTFDMGTHAAVITVNGGNNMMCVRVTDSTDVAATAVIGSTNLTLTGKYTGSYGNNIVATIQAGALTNTWRVIIGVPGYVPEIYDTIGTTSQVTTGTVGSAMVATATCVFAAPVTGIVPGMTVSGTGISGTPTVLSVTNSTTVVLSAVQTVSSAVVLTFTPSNNEFWVNIASAINNGQNALRGASNWVVATAGSGTTAPTATAYQLSGGTDGASGVTATTLVGNSASGTGMYALSNSGMAFLDVCDMTTSGQFTTVDAFASQQSCYAIQALPSGTTVSGAVSAKQSSGLNSFSSKLMHGDWLFWNDPVNQLVRLVSPQAFVAGRLSNLSPEQTSLNKPIAGVAGSQTSGNGSFNAFYSSANLTTLETNGIDVVTNPGGGQLPIWTCRFGHNSSTNITVHLDNYPTLTDYIASTLEAGLGYYLGLPISQQLFQNITATLTQYMQVLTGQGLLVSPDGTTPYSVLCNISNNPPEQTNLGIVQAAVQAKYPSINEKFLVNLQGGNTITVTLASQTQ